MIISLFPVAQRVTTMVVANIYAENDAEKVSLPLLAPPVWPTDPTKAPTFYFLMLWQATSLLVATGTTCTTDAFTCSLMLAASERCAMLVRAAPQALLPGPGKTVTPHFKAWVQYHQHYLRIVDGINDVMGPFILVIHVITLTFIIIYCFAIIRIEERATKVIAVSVLIGQLTRLSVYATAGQRVLDQSVVLRNSVVGVAQVARGGLGAGPYRNALQVLVTRLSAGADPEEVNGLGYFTLSMENFNSMLSASFSYLMVLLSFK